MKISRRCLLGLMTFIIIIIIWTITEEKGEFNVLIRGGK